MENTTETTAVVLPEKLNQLATNSGLELNKAIEHAFKFVPSMKEINELSKALSIMDKENPSEIDVKTARRNRLDLVKVRGDAKKTKEQLKENILTEGKLIDKLFNTVIDTAELSESEYEAIEKHAENKEKARKEALRIERSQALSPYTENTSIYPLGEMTEDNFAELLEGLKLAKENKIKAEQEAERLRLEKIEADRIENERIRVENEKLKAEKAEADRLAAIEKKKNDEAIAKLEAEKKAAAEKAAAEKKKQDDLIAKQKAEADRLQKEIDDKKAAELKAKKEAEEKRQQEEKDRIAAEKKAAKAPDKEKLKAFVNSFIMPELTTAKSPEALKVESEIIEKFNGFKMWATKQIESI
jgi:hypothetical protein